MLLIESKMKRASHRLAAHRAALRIASVMGMRRAGVTGPRAGKYGWWVAARCCFTLGAEAENRIDIGLVAYVCKPLQVVASVQKEAVLCSYRRGALRSQRRLKRAGGYSTTSNIPDSVCCAGSVSEVRAKAA